MLYNRQEFTLRSRLGQVVMHIDPMGTEETETSIGRSEKTFGIFTTVANNLKFIGDTMDWLLMNYEIDGVNAEVELSKKVKHNRTDEWFIPKGFPGYLDFTTMKVEDNQLSIDFIEGGLKEILEAQSREKFELDRLEDIQGNPISELITDELSLEGRDIYLLSKYEERTDTFTTMSGRYSSVNNNREGFHPLPITLVANSDPMHLSDPMEDYQAEERSNIPTIGRMFFSTSDREGRSLKFSGSVKLKTEAIDQRYANEFSMRFVLKRYTSVGDNIEFIENLLEFPMGFPNIGQEFTFNIPTTILEPNINDSYALGFQMIGQYGAGAAQGHIIAKDGWANITFTELEANFTVSEDSFFERTNAQFLTLFDIGNRLTEIFTGRRKFISSLLSEGSWKDFGATCGGWLRNLKKKVDITDAQGIVLRTDLLPWSMTYSFDDFFKSIHATQPVGFGIVTKGSKQFLALENIRFFFQPYVTIKLGDVSNVKTGVAKEFVFTSVTTGYTKGGNYEEPLGLDEYNVQTTWTTPIEKGGESKYEVLSPSRADSYGVEQARRMPFSLFPDEDTPFDQDNFLIDAKFSLRSNVRNYYEVAKWAEHFEVAPTGIFSPDTTFNLRLSPVNNLYRHSVWFNSAIHKYPDQRLLHANSEGNSQLQTKPIGKPLRKEHEAVPVSELSNPIFEPMWIEFETDASQEVIDQIQGTSEVNGRTINNYYGLVECYIGGVKTRGYLFTAKIADTINWKILKSYGF